MVVGNPSVVAVESTITRAFQRPSRRALGFFAIHLDGKTYGVRKPDASLLACSFDAVVRRIARRGTHCVSFASEPDAARIADLVRAAMYDAGRQDEMFFGMSAEEMREAVASSEILWAPDGDEAFDDGSHILQFDQNDSVRLIGFKNLNRPEDIARTLAEVSVSADEFYGLLQAWRDRFESEWLAAEKSDPFADSPAPGRE